MPFGSTHRMYNVFSVKKFYCGNSTAVRIIIFVAWWNTKRGANGPIHICHYIAIAQHLHKYFNNAKSTLVKHINCNLVRERKSDSYIFWFSTFEICRYCITIESTVCLHVGELLLEYFTISAPQRKNPNINNHCNSWNSQIKTTIPSTNTCLVVLAAVSTNILLRFCILRINQLAKS